MPSLPPPPSLNPATATRLRELVLGEGFPRMGDPTYDGMLSAALPRRARRPLLNRMAARDDLDAKAALVIAFCEQLPVPQAALGDELAELLLEAGLLETMDGGRVFSRLTLTNLHGALIAADAMGSPGETVMIPGPGTARLAGLVPAYTEGARLLDLCAGPGSIAIVAAGHGYDVVATDLSERCLEFMRANALLNGVDIDIRLGDLFEPVTGEQFDVVMSHPPYVELPAGVESVLFLHGGERGEELPYLVVGGVPDVLADHGQAFVEFHGWGEPDHVSDHVRSLIRGSHCDLALFTAMVSDPDSRAVNNGFMHDPDFGPEFDPAVVTYRDHLDRIGHDSTAAIAYLRRHPAEDGIDPWATMISGERLPNRWDLVERYVRGIDVLSSGGAIEAAKVRAPTGSRLVLEIPVGDEEGEREFSVRMPRETFAGSRGLTPRAAELFDALCTAPTVGDVISGFAKELDEDPEAVRARVVDFVREHVLRGVLIVDPGA